MKANGLILRLSPITEALSDGEVEFLNTLLVAEAFATGELICSSNSPHHDSLFIVMSGGIKVRLTSQEGRLTVHAINLGDVANILAFMGASRATATSTLHAEGATSVLRLDRHTLERHLYSHPGLVYRLTCGITRYVHSRLRHLCGEVEALNQRITCTPFERQMQQGEFIRPTASHTELVMG
ncbi:MAG: cyclic nucleotide-binding domain-containing protein [Sideroxydans sp.]|nr:cyclic nucleotide-binding domain-containing protein [Sideroxydans sp.]